MCYSFNTRGYFITYANPGKVEKGCKNCANFVNIYNEISLIFKGVLQLGKQIEGKPFDYEGRRKRMELRRLELEQKKEEEKKKRASKVVVVEE